MHCLSEDYDSEVLASLYSTYCKIWKFGCACCLSVFQTALLLF